jgi:hypothetical protein
MTYIFGKIYLLSKSKWLHATALRHTIQLQWGRTGVREGAGTENARQDNKTHKNTRQEKTTQESTPQHETTHTRMTRQDMTSQKWPVDKATVRELVGIKEERGGQ